MPLNELSLEELTELAGTLDQVREAGTILAAYGLHPTFDLTPGQDATITLPFRMPDVQADAPVQSFEDYAKAYVRRAGGGTAPQLRRGFTHSTEAAQPEPAPAPVEPVPVPGEVTGAGTHSAEPSRSGGEADPPPAVAEASLPPLAKAAPPEAQADSGGGVAVAAADSAPAATHQDKLLPATWQAEEDERLIEIIVTCVQIGKTKKAAIAKAAHELGRPEAGTAFRARHKLKARIDAALTAAAMHQAQTEAPTRSPEAARQDESPAAEVLAEASVPHGGEPPAPEPKPGAGGHEVPAAANVPGLHGLDLTLWHWLQDNRPKWPITWLSDLDLVEALARGEKLPVISADLGIDAGLLKNRFHTLTNRILDARGNPTIDGQRRLIEVLRRIVASAAKVA